MSFPPIVDGCDRWARSLDGKHFEVGIGRAGHQSFVWIYLRVLRMIDCQQLHCIKINYLFKLVVHAQREYAIARAQLLASYPHILISIGIVIASGTGQVSDC